MLGRFTGASLRGLTRVGKPPSRQCTGGKRALAEVGNLSPAAAPPNPLAGVTGFDVEVVKRWVPRPRRQVNCRQATNRHAPGQDQVYRQLPPLGFPRPGQRHGQAVRYPDPIGRFVLADLGRSHWSSANLHELGTGSSKCRAQEDLLSLTPAPLLPAQGPPSVMSPTSGNSKKSRKNSVAVSGSPPTMPASVQVPSGPMTSNL